MARVAAEHLVAVGDGALVVPGEEVDGGALVPSFREVGLALDDLREAGDRRLVLSGLHLLDAARHQRIDRGFARAAP